MAKHSHWHNIRHQKAAADYKKAQIIAKMGTLITVAVQMGGPIIDANPRLRLVLDKARSAKMSMEAVERAIKKASGEAAAGKLMLELTYEGYGPGGVALVVECLTDNRNRTAPEIKKLFERGTGAMGAPGCVAWQFNDVALFAVENTSEDAVMEALMAADVDAQEIQAEEGGVTIVAAPADYDAVKKALAAAKLTIASSELTKIAENRVTVDDPDKAAQVQALIDSLDDHDDVQAVHHNADFP